MCSSEKLGSHHGQFDNMPLVSNSLNDDKQQISAGTGLNRNPQPVTLVALQSTWPHGAAIETIFKDLSYGGSQKSRLDNRMVSRTPSWTSNSTSNWRQIGLWPSLKHHLGCLPATWLPFYVIDTLGYLLTYQICFIPQFFVVVTLIQVLIRKRYKNKNIPSTYLPSI